MRILLLIPETQNFFPHITSNLSFTASTNCNPLALDFTPSLGTSIPAAQTMAFNKKRR